MANDAKEELSKQVVELFKQLPPDAQKVAFYVQMVDFLLHKKHVTNSVNFNFKYRAL